MDRETKGTKSFGRADFG